MSNAHLNAHLARVATSALGRRNATTHQLALHRLSTRQQGRRLHDGAPLIQTGQVRSALHSRGDDDDDKKRIGGLPSISVNIAGSGIGPRAGSHGASGAFQVRLFSCSSMPSLATTFSLPSDPLGVRYLSTLGPKRTSTTVAPTTTSPFSSQSTDEGEEEKSAVERGREAARKGATVARERGREAALKAATVTREGAVSSLDKLKKYGPVFVYTYFGIYIATWSSLFLLIDSGLLDPASISFDFGGWFGGGGGEEAATAVDATEAVSAGVEDGASAATAATSTGSEGNESKSTVKWIASHLEKWEWTKPYAKVVEKNPHVANLAVAWLATKPTEPIRLGIALVVVPRIARWLGRVPPSDELNEDGAVREKDDVENEDRGAEEAKTVVADGELLTDEQMSRREGKAGG